MKHCEACGSMAVGLCRVRPDLAYWICSDCGHCFMEMREQGAEDFEKAQKMYFGEDSILVQSEPSAMDREILAKREWVTSTYVAPQGTVLEVGPGTGFFSEWLQKRGHELCLVEHSPILAAALEKRLGVHVDTGEFETKDIAPNSVEAFCSFHVIEHVSNPLRHLAAGLAAVRPDGIGLVATPNAKSWQQIWFRMLSPNFDAAHLRVFSPRSLRRFCEHAGWEVVRVETPEFASGWLRVLSKALRKMRGEDENLTAGKYAKVASARFERIYAALAALTWPFRRLQSRVGAGNEILFVLRKPRSPETVAPEIVAADGDGDTR